MKNVSDKIALVEELDIKPLNNDMGFAYLVYITEGMHPVNNYLLFIIQDEAIAKAYQRKFDGILLNWKNFFNQFTESRLGYKWKGEFKDHFNNPLFRRWQKIKDVNGCYIEKIQIK